MPVLVGGVDLELLQADTAVKARFIEAVEEGCLEIMVRQNIDAPHTRSFWATKLRAKPIGVVSETAVAGLKVEDAAALSASEEFLDIVLEKVSGVPQIQSFLLPGSKLFVLKETTTATTTTQTKTSITGTSTTSTTTTLPSPEEAAKALLGAVKETSASLLGALGEGNESAVVAELPDGGTMAVSKLEVKDELGSALAEAVAALAAGGDDGNGDYGGSVSYSGDVSEGDYVEPVVPSVDVKVPGTGIDVALPVTMFAAFQVKEGVEPADIAMVVTAFDADSANIKGMGKRPDPEVGGVKVEVAGAATIDLVNLASGSTLNVNGLREPIKFSLPLNFTPGMKCSYWDEEREAWSTQGVWVSRANIPGEKIICKTRHLSLFGALIESIIETLTCANVLNLMNEEAFQEVLTGEWLTSMGTVMFGFLIALLIVNYIAAAIIDYRRWLTHHFKDEFLLVYKEPVQDARSTSPQGGAWRDVAAGMLCGCCMWLQESEVIRQAIDDIASSWCAYFGEIRTGVEACLDCIKVDAAVFGAGVFLGRLKGLSHKVTAKIMLLTSRRTAAADLCMTEDIVAFALDDEDLADYLVSERSQGQGNWRRTPDQRSAIAGLREEVSQHMLTMTVKQGHARPHNLAFAKSVCMLLLTQNPIGALFVLDIFSSCKQRVLIFSAEMLGALTVSCVFFEASGMAKGKPKGKGCGADDEGGADPVKSLGRFVVIALGCLFIAGLPVHALSSLQTKKFKVMTSPPGSEAWHRQLRVWKFQERLVLVLATLYIVACSVYILMFIANIGDADHQEFSFMGFLTLFQDVLLLPFLTALMVPLFAQVLLSLHLLLTGVKREHFVRVVCTILHNSSNAMLPVERL